MYSKWHQADPKPITVLEEAPPSDYRNRIVALLMHFALLSSLKINWFKEVMESMKTELKAQGNFSKKKTAISSKSKDLTLTSTLTQDNQPSTSAAQLTTR